MAEYIDRIDAIKAVNEQNSLTMTRAAIVDRLNSIPTIDAEPVVYAEWIDKPTGRYNRWQSWCSACGEHNRIGGIESNRHRPRCPHCGAHMQNGGR